MSLNDAAVNIEKVLDAAAAGVLEIKNKFLSQFNSETLREFLHHEFRSESLAQILTLLFELLVRRNEKPTESDET